MTCAAFLLATPCCRRKLSTHSGGVRIFKTAVTKCALSDNVNAQQQRGQLSLALGSVGVISVLINRVLLTPLSDLTSFQSRSDILCVVGAISLLVYGVSQIDITTRKKDAVLLNGVDTPIWTSSDCNAPTETAFALATLLGALPFVQTVVVFTQDQCTAAMGILNENIVQKLNAVTPGELVRNAVVDRKRAYLADMNVVPTKDVEFAYLPRNCQAVVVQPVGKHGAIVLAANKVRPMTANDFGWVQAVADRLASESESE